MSAAPGLGRTVRRLIAGLLGAPDEDLKRETAEAVEERREQVKSLATFLEDLKTGEVCAIEAGTPETVPPQEDGK